jgi:hypothetical protein
VGVVVSGQWAVWRWAPGFRVNAESRYNIGWAETIAVELGLRLALHAGLLKARGPYDRDFLVRSDNSGVVAVLNKFIR